MASAPTELPRLAGSVTTIEPLASAVPPEYVFVPLSQSVPVADFARATWPWPLSIVPLKLVAVDWLAYFPIFPFAARYSKSDCRSSPPASRFSETSLTPECHDPSSITVTS